LDIILSELSIISYIPHYAITKLEKLKRSFYQNGKFRLQNTNFRIEGWALVRKLS